MNPDRSGRDMPKQGYPIPTYMARPEPSWLDETVTVRRVLGNAAFLILCVFVPVVLALAFLR